MSLVKQHVSLGKVSSEQRFYVDDLCAVEIKEISRQRDEISIHNEAEVSEFFTLKNEHGRLRLVSKMRWYVSSMRLFLRKP